MARIPSEELERLKSDVPIAAIVEAAGVKLAKHGADLRGLCPFHDDKEPSLVVTPAKNLWHCLGMQDGRKRRRLGDARPRREFSTRRRHPAR